MTRHPDYPPANGDPEGDRCICGGIRHWHAVAPYGCDDCDCTAFTATNATWQSGPERVLRLAIEGETDDDAITRAYQSYHAARAANARVSLAAEDARQSLAATDAHYRTHDRTIEATS